VQLNEDLAERLIFSPLMDVHKLPSSYGPAQFWARALRPLYVRFGVSQSTANHTAAPAADLSPHLLSRLCAALEKCRTFRDDAALLPLFVDRRISPWRGDCQTLRIVPARHCRDDYLLPQNQHFWRKCSVLFLRVLADRTSPRMRRIASFVYSPMHRG
jgi:hypothetical protein